MYGRVHAITLAGIHGRAVVVETTVGRGLPALCLTGLPGASVHDARERVRPAVEQSGFEWPLRRVVVNLSPVDLRKEGPGLDLPIAMAVLAATGQIPSTSLESTVFAGELSLRGELKPIPGALSIAAAAKQEGFDAVVVPAGNAPEAGLVEGVRVAGATTLREVVGLVRGTWSPPPIPTVDDAGASAPEPDFADVRGQAVARRALEIAAAGGHNVLLIGSPGAGKTMLARRLPSILPSMSREEALEVTQLHSVAGLLGRTALIGVRPFRAPHHSISTAGLLGGGTGTPRPGEVSLAHEGVLFLDEFAEFRRDALEGLRQPLEDGRVLLRRASGMVEFPARFTLVAAANPCPCGYDADPVRACECSPQRAASYRAKLSGPVADRIDLRVYVPRLTPRELLGRPQGEPSAAIKQRVEASRARQRASLAPFGATCNAQLGGPAVRRLVDLDSTTSRMLSDAVERLQLTGRGVDRALKVARTIADLDGADAVTPKALAEALSLRAPRDAEELVRAG